ncbi:MAG: hypothetical protein ABF526_12025 [Liquorilactobacillus nagelii]|uniref:hypothetical protein n=1 Tax=Liquorilactobacillus nagelii TaxID=82688 RepID=UPI0039EAB103
MKYKRVRVYKLITAEEKSINLPLYCFDINGNLTSEAMRMIQNKGYIYLKDSVVL